MHLWPSLLSFWTPLIRGFSAVLPTSSFGVFFQFPSPRAVCSPRDHLALAPNLKLGLFAILVPHAPLRWPRSLRDRSFEARCQTKHRYSKRETVSTPCVPVWVRARPKPTERGPSIPAGVVLASGVPTWALRESRVNPVEQEKGFRLSLSAGAQGFVGTDRIRKHKQMAIHLR
ncbi:hypothetical protein PAPYR_8603 [Paratrimastix pyriformis]|uniref:Secreted protein n=1 Tax=Paratrimastix pyriformis TaxID=342808 RepID=A0ABQ8UAA2_9EUKA|nr:hypothetical protein PAPYR_8603 [Paratrimastix pyriformis]